MNNDIKATNNVGIEIIIPYLIKLRKLYFTSCLLTKSVNIIPANAPIGVKHAPILEPIIVEYISCLSTNTKNQSTLQYSKTSTNNP